MLKELKNHIWKFVLLVIRFKEYRYRNLFLSLLGIQIIRIIFYKIEYSLKSIFYQNKNIDAPNKKINSKLSAISSSKNTFVLTDNRGFHSRGNMKEGTTRKQIRIQYTYLEIPFYSKLMLRLLYFYNKKLYRAYF